MVRHPIMVAHLITVARRIMVDHGVTDMDMGPVLPATLLWGYTPAPFQAHLGCNSPTCKARQTDTIWSCELQAVEHCHCADSKEPTKHNPWLDFFYDSNTNSDATYYDAGRYYSTSSSTRYSASSSAKLSRYSAATSAKLSRYAKEFSTKRSRYSTTPSGKLSRYAKSSAAKRSSYSEQLLSSAKLSKRTSLCGIGSACVHLVHRMSQGLS